MASHTAVVERVHEVFRRTLNVDVPSPDADLIDGGILDSLALVELLFQLEQEFGIEILLDQLDIENFRTIDRIAAFVAGREVELHGA